VIRIDTVWLAVQPLERLDYEPGVFTVEHGPRRR